MIDTNVIDQNDLGKDWITLLEDCIYETNKIRVPREHIVYGTPVPLDQRPDDPTDPNTYIDVKIDPDWDYELSKLSGFMYRRQDLDQYLQDVNITITVDKFPFLVSDVWNQQVLPLLPFPIPVSEIQDYQFTNPNNKKLLVRAKNSSYLWSGRISLTINPINPALLQLAQTHYLTGFIEYQLGLDPVLV